ncbi:MAG: pgl [Chloroflexi bacterium]|nr:pgl [Chloroflexota bacterium]
MADRDRGHAQFSISETMDELVRTAATGIVQAARSAVAARGAFSIALSGGSTPRLLYQFLATPAVAAETPWKDIQVFWGDERHVPPDHPDSNYRMVRGALLDHVPVPEKNIHRIKGELPEADATALAYEIELRRIFGLDGGESAEGPVALPRFDLILLGMGEDGHTASLFPHSPALAERKALVVANPVEKLGTTRITLTVPIINNAARVWFLIAGGSKAHVLKDVLEGPYQPDLLPSQLINPTDGNLTFLLDNAAAAELSPRFRENTLAGIG